jgi:hypothetical protein
MSIFPSEFYGDQMRWFIGTVEQFGGDEPKLGRVRVRIHGIHDQSIRLSDLPYAQVVIPTTEGGVSGIGRSCGLEEGATVFGIFMDGKSSQLPLVLGSIPKIESPSRVQNYMGRPGEEYIPMGDYSTADSVLLGKNKTYAPTADSKENTKLAWDFLIQRGYSPMLTAAMLGNFMHESRMNPGIENPNDKGARSVGLAQWRFYGTSGGRQTELFQYADNKKTDWRDLYLQLSFADHELTSYGYLGGSDFKRASTLTEATLIFMRKFENPATVGGTSVDGASKRSGEDDRLKQAASIFNNYTFSGGSV